MNVLTVILVSLKLNIPDSIFLPTNALEINPPRWEFVYYNQEKDYLKAGYHTDFRIKFKSFYFAAEERYDYEPFTSLENRYFIATRFFSISHGVYGLLRNRSQYSIILRDTVDLYFSWGRIIPNITLLPGLHYFRKDSTAHAVFNLPIAFSIVYSGTEGVLTYSGIERTDMLSRRGYEDIYRAGVGIMGNRKFVSLGLTSKLIPEFNLKVLITGGAYLDLHYGYDIKTPHLFSYLYPDGITGDSIMAIMERRLSILIDKKPVLLNLNYRVPDSVFKKSLDVEFAFKGKYLDIQGEYFKLLGNYENFLTVYGVTNRALSKLKAVAHIPMWGKLVYSPILCIYQVQDKSGRVYNAGGRLEYQRGRFQFFWEHHLFTRGTIEETDPTTQDKLQFFKERRFKIGTKYSF